MADDKEIVATRYGKHSTFEVVKDKGTFSTKYYIRKNGEAHRGPYDSLQSAVRAAEEESGDER